MRSHDTSGYSPGWPMRRRAALNTITKADRDAYPRERA